MGLKRYSSRSYGVRVPRFERPGRVLTAVVATLVVAVAAALGIWWLATGEGRSESDTEVLQAAADRALLERDFDEARQIAERWLEQQPDSTAALLLAAKAAAETGRFEEAVQYWQDVPGGQGQTSAEAAYQAGKVLLHELHQASEAEAMLRRALDEQPGHPEATRELAYLLGVEARRWEAVPLILNRFRQKEVSLDHLAMLGRRYGMIVDAELLMKCYQTDSQDPPVLLGLAATEAIPKQPAQTVQLLAAAVARRPDLIEAQVRLGSVLLMQDQLVAFTGWHQNLPPDAESHPETWLLRAEWARRQGQTKAAMRCFAETVQRDPNHRVAIHQLGQLMLREGMSAEAQPVLERELKLQQYRQLEDLILDGDLSSLDPVRDAVGQLEQLGRIWEAWGWAMVAGQLDPQLTWPASEAARLESKLPSDLVLTAAEFNPVRNLSYESWPLPTWELRSQPATPVDPVAEASQAEKPAFTNVAQEAGVEFTYSNGGDPTAGGHRMYEFPGGGAGVLDFDADGWPDVYLAQGRPWADDSTQRKYLDRLYRNRGDGRLQDVTQQAGIIEPNFSHGVAVGDIDNDGFQDLYVANIGKNRLFRNNGDGTFRDVSEQVLGDTGRWTVSCAIADLSGDGLPEIYDVNYLEADDVFERLCRHDDGKSRACMPFHFPGSFDQMYLNQGDGRFKDVSEEAGVALPDGKGLGIVVADLEGDQQLEMIIANDTTANFLFRRESRADKSLPRFSEEGRIRGWAFNTLGRAEGSMGIAVGDATGDGLLDLFVTSFLKETNTFYEQQEGGFLVDVTEDKKLAEPSLELLGFGTQFVDADLDGWLDLLVTNGHVDDVRDYGRAYHMRPQFFWNRKGRQFAELRADSVGEFFGGEYLGRAMARLDYNRDGREDVVISHLDSPVALLANTTQQAGHYLTVHLRGTRSSRDAIGATVTLVHREGQLVRQLTAGDGYESSNQRMLSFGLGDEPSPTELVVQWPSGLKETFPDPPIDSELVLVEGRGMYRLR